jgi:hypothetical protein
VLFACLPRWLPGNPNSQSSNHILFEPKRFIDARFDSLRAIQYELDRNKDKADVAFVASRRQACGYAA